MDLMTFDYTKKDGTSKHRAVVIHGKPAKHYEGTDVTELDEEDQVAYLTKCNMLVDEFMSKLAELQEEYDLVQSYRTFIPENMQDIETFTG